MSVPGALPSPPNPRSQPSTDRPEVASTSLQPVVSSALSASAASGTPAPLSEAQNLSIESISQFEQLLETEGASESDLRRAYDALPEVLRNTVEGYVYLFKAQEKGAATITDPDYGKHAVEASIEVLYPIKWREKFRNDHYQPSFFYYLNATVKYPDVIRSAFTTLPEDIKNQIYGYVYEEHAIERGKPECQDRGGEPFGKYTTRENPSILKSFSPTLRATLWKAALRDSLIATADRVDALQYRIPGKGLLDQNALLGSFEFRQGDTSPLIDTACFLISSGAVITPDNLVNISILAMQTGRFIEILSLLQKNSDKPFAYNLQHVTTYTSNATVRCIIYEVQHIVISAARDSRLEDLKLCFSQLGSTITQETIASAFKIAIELGRLPILEFFLSDNRFSKYIQSVLDKNVYTAASEGNLQQLEFLTSQDRSVTPEELEKAFTIASEKGHKDAMKLLLSKCSSISYNTMRNTLNLAVTMQDLNVVQSLLLKYFSSKSVERIPHTINDAITASLQKGDLPMVQLLLSKGRILSQKGLDSWDQSDRIELAKSLAREGDPIILIQYISRLGIDPSTQQKGLIEILKLCAKKIVVPPNTTKYIGVTSEEAIHSVTILSLIEALLRPLPDRPFDLKLFKDLLNQHLSISETQFYPRESSILALLDKEKKSCEGALEDSPITLKYRLHYLMALYVALESKRIQQERAEAEDSRSAGVASTASASAEIFLIDEKIHGVLGKILSIGNNSIQVHLTTVLTNVLNDPQLSAHFESLLKSAESKSAGFEYAVPILLTLASWCQDMKEPEKIKKGEKSPFDNFKARIQVSIQANRDAIKYKKLNITCLQALGALDATPLSAKEKLDLFTGICEKPLTESEKRRQAAAERAYHKEKHKDPERRTPEESASIAEYEKQAAEKEVKAKQFEKSLRYLALLSQTGFFCEGVPDALKGEFTFETLEKAAIDKAKVALFGQEGISPEYDDLLQRGYLDLIAQQRRAFGLEFYASQIHSLRDQSLNLQMTRLAVGALDGSFRDKRYDVSLSPHLQTMQQYFPELWRAWQSLPAPEDLSAVSRSSRREPAGVAAAAASEEAVSSIEHESYLWLKRTLNTPGHLPPGIHSPDAIREFLDEAAKFKDAEMLSSSLTSAEENPYLEMQKLCFSLCRKGITVSDTKDILLELQKFVSEKPELQHSQWKRDIDDRIRILSPKKQEGAFEACITDNWQDLFLCGTEVLGSCQSIDGNLGLNKCLLSYCLDGKIQMVAVKEKETGKISSRALLKLLLRNEGGKWAPALFLERIYPDPCPKDQEDSINKLAIDRARELGVELYTINQDFAIEGTPAVLQSIGCPCPFEYEDGHGGNGGISNNGLYQIYAHKVTI